MPPSFAGLKISTKIKSSLDEINPTVVSLALFLCNGSVKGGKKVKPLE